MEDFERSRFGLPEEKDPWKEAGNKWKDTAVGLINKRIQGVVPGGEFFLIKAHVKDQISQLAGLLKKKTKGKPENDLGSWEDI